MPHLKKMYLSSNKELSAAAGLLGGGGLEIRGLKTVIPMCLRQQRRILLFRGLLKKGEQSEGIKGTPTEPKRHLNSSAWDEFERCWCCIGEEAQGKGDRQEWWMTPGIEPASSHRFMPVHPYQFLWPFFQWSSPLSPCLLSPFLPALIAKTPLRFLLENNDFFFFFLKVPGSTQRDTWWRLRRVVVSLPSR